MKKHRIRESWMLEGYFNSQSKYGNVLFGKHNHIHIQLGIKWKPFQISLIDFRVNQLHRPRTDHTQTPAKKT